MEGVSIIETKTLEALIIEVQDLKHTVVSTITELNSLKKQYLTPNDLMEVTGFGKTWVNDNKHLIGFTMVGGCLRFKRKDVEEFMEANYFKTKIRRTR